MEKKSNKREGFAKRTISIFFHLNITRKILLGYLFLAILIVVISGYALSNLDRLNEITQSILKRDVVLIETTEKMIDNVLAQELYARRYRILRSEDMLALFRERSREFEQMIEKIRGLPGGQDVPVDRFASLHDKYNELFTRSFAYLKDPLSAAGQKYEAEIKKKQAELIGQIKTVSSQARLALNEKMITTSQIGTTAFKVAWILCASGVTLGAVAAFWIARNISGSIHQLKHATKEISEGKFEYTSDLGRHDELGELSFAFGEMAGRLKRLETMYLDASPLTRLPGSVAIDNVLRKRISTGAPLAFCLIDMDNFKAFSDHYGYARGSELIKATAKMLESVITELGMEEDFLGHIGGDDFVIITVPDRFPKLANAIIERFDNLIGGFYNDEDRVLGYIVANNRQGQEMNFPLMTISIAVVTNQYRELIDPLQVGEIVAELKEYAKSIPGSVYVVDKRRKEGEQLSAQDEKVIPFPKKGSAGSGV
jgi:GGDEF domain-containing protein/CHASE3 domain sensor protein